MGHHTNQLSFSDYISKPRSLNNIMSTYVRQAKILTCLPVDMLFDIYPTSVGLHLEVQLTQCRHLVGHLCQSMSIKCQTISKI